MNKTPRNLREELRVARTEIRDLRNMLTTRCETIRAHETERDQIKLYIQSAGKHFERLRASIHLQRMIAEEAENLAGHFAAAYK